MHRCLIILASILSQVTCDCLHAEWKKTCQKYCMDNKLYEIQLNQCYSMNPAQLKCKCSGQDLTEKIKNILESNNPNSPSLITTSTVFNTITENTTCIPSHSCKIGKISCHAINSYCTCNNGTWISILCSNGNICKTQGTLTSCQTALSLDEQISLLSRSSETNKYLYIYIVFLFIFW